MSFKKEEERLKFVLFTNENTLVPFSQVGLVTYNAREVDFIEAFSDLASRYKDASEQDSPNVLREAYSIFKKAMKPIAEKRFYSQKDDDSIGYLYLHFMDIDITFENGIRMSSSPTSVDKNTVSYLDMKKFSDLTSDKDKSSRTWDVQNVYNVICGRPLTDLPVQEEEEVIKEVPSWLTPRAASKTKLSRVSSQPFLG